MQQKKTDKKRTKTKDLPSQISKCQHYNT